MWKSCWLYYLIVVPIWLSFLGLTFLHILAASYGNFAGYLMNKFFEENPYRSAALKLHKKTPVVP
jgi:hypothetical protein